MAQMPEAAYICSPLSPADKRSTMNTSGSRTGLLAKILILQDGPNSMIFNAGVNLLQFLHGCWEASRTWV